MPNNLYVSKEWFALKTVKRITLFYFRFSTDAPDDLSVLFDCLESFADRSDISPVKYSVISENATYEDVQGNLLKNRENFS